MSPNTPTFRSIERVKMEADQQAIQNAVISQRMIGRPMPPLIPMVIPNLRFFRRLRGLRNGDLNG